MVCDPAVTMTHRDVKYRADLVQMGMNELLWDRFNLRCFTFSTRVELPRRQWVYRCEAGEKYRLVAQTAIVCGLVVTSRVKCGSLGEKMVRKAGL